MIVPMITVQEGNGVNCYGLPSVMVNWTISLVGMANMRTNLFMAEVVFRKI